MLGTQILSAQNMSAGLQEYIEKKFEQVYQQDSDFLPLIERQSEETPTNFRGRRIPVELSANPSLSHGNPARGALATPGAPSNNFLNVRYQWLNAGIEVDYEAVMNNAQNPVEDTLKRTLDNTVTQVNKWLNIYASNSNGTTAIATLSATPAGATVTCNGATDSIGATQVLRNQKVLIFDPTGATQRVGGVGTAALTVSAISATTVTFTSNAPSDAVAGDIIVPEGLTVGVKGIPFIVNNSGMYFGLNRSTEPTLQSTVVNAAGTLTAGLLLRTYNLIFQKSGSKGLGALEMFFNITQHTAYYNLTTQSGFAHQYVHNGSSKPGVDLGGESMEFSFFNVPMRRMLDFRGDSIYFLNRSYIKVAMLKKMGKMLNMPAGEWLQAINGTSDYVAAKQQWQDVALDIYSNAPHRHGVLNGLSMTGLPQQKG